MQPQAEPIKTAGREQLEGILDGFSAYVDDLASEFEGALQKLGWSLLAFSLAFAATGALLVINREISSHLQTRGPVMLVALSLCPVLVAFGFSMFRVIVSAGTISVLRSALLKGIGRLESVLGTMSQFDDQIRQSVARDSTHSDLALYRAELSLKRAQRLKMFWF